MNIYLLQVISKSLMMVVVGIISLFGLNLSEDYDYQNSNLDKTINVVSTINNFETTYKYNSKIPKGDKKVLIEGVNGVSFFQDQKEIVLQEKVDEVIEIGTGSVGAYSGTLTAYGPDCVGCTGVLACPNKAGKWLNLYDSATYVDETYGEVNILAATRDVFPCGTIIEISNDNMDKVIGVVLDTGYQMRKMWNEKSYIWIDFATEQDGQNALKYTDHNTNYKVKRWGW